MPTTWIRSASTVGADVQYQLTDFQLDASAKLVARIRSSQEAFDSSGELSAIVLSAITGAGKTVIATAVIEELLFGGDTSSGDPDTTILWVTDDPSLNQQTMEKMQAASEKLWDLRIIGQGARINQEHFDPGVVYFLNIQAASRTATISNRTDTQRFTIWETIENTVKSMGSRFVVVVDEAHRGLGTPGRDSYTIVNRIIDGPRRVPVFVGISATTQKLLHSLANQPLTDPRTVKTVQVPVAAVQESGLVKDLIQLYSPDVSDKGALADTTLIREAVRRTRDFEARWAAYTESQKERPVAPALIIQLGNTPGVAEIAEIVDAVLSEWEGLRSLAIVNTFGERSNIDLGGSRVVTYMAPHEIQDASDVRVVLAKEAITTGWDCPRAEVLVSLRTVHDHTSIAQLIGRIVRQPLARRIDTDDSLNKVFCFLPNFDPQGVQQVVAQFADPESELPQLRASRTVLTYRRRTGADPVATRLAALPSYDVPSQVPAPDSRRLNGLAAELAFDAIYPEAPLEARRLINIALDGEQQRLGAELDVLRTGVEMLGIRMTEITTAGDVTESLISSEGALRDERNVDAVYRESARRLRDGIANGYWDYLVDKDETQAFQHKVTVAALGCDAFAVQAVQERAAAIVKQWFEKFGKAIAELPDTRQVAYDRLRKQSREPERTQVAVADLVEEAQAVSGEEELTDAALLEYFRSDSNNRWDGHLYVDAEDGRYWANLNDDEAEALTVELGSDASTAWYRNPPSGRRSLTVPYERDGRWYALHPDFLVFRSAGDDVTATIVDPHGDYLSDSTARLLGMLEYADQHSSEYGAIWPITRISGKLRGIPLQLEATRTAVRAAVANLPMGDSLESIFLTHGVEFAK